MITRNTYEYPEDLSYEGLSTDQKPLTGVATNSLFLELDTGKFYYFNGTAWVELGTAGS